MKRDKQIRFCEGNLGDAIVQRSARARKKSRKKRTKIHFSIFIKNRNWDLNLVFRFDNENEKRKKIKILFHFKTKIECPFWPTDCARIHFKSVHRKYNSFFDLKTKRILKIFHFSFFNFKTKIEKWKNFLKFIFWFQIKKWNRKFWFLLFEGGFKSK